MSILLIRHGETAGNANRVVQVPETPLSERGIAQARRLGQRLKTGAISRILASDLSRAQMTAEALQEATGAPLELDALLHERNFGVHRGTAYADLGVDLFAPDYAPPEGEANDVFHERVDLAWQRIQEMALAESGDLAVVTHGLVCHSLVSRRLDVPAAAFEAAGMTPPDRGRVDFASLRFGNTALTVIDAREPWSVSLLACTTHLDAANADDDKAISGL